MARTITKRKSPGFIETLKSMFQPDPEQSGFTAKLPGTRGAMKGEINTDDMSPTKGGDVVTGYGTPSSSRLIKAYRQSTKTPAYTGLPAPKQRTFRRGVERDLAKYRDIV